MYFAFDSNRLAGKGFCAIESVLFWCGPHLPAPPPLSVLPQQGNVFFSLPFVPGHQPLRATDIGGLIFVVTGLVVYRFGPALSNFFGLMGVHVGGDRGGKVATSKRGRGSRSSYAVAEHREPLLDLAEEGEDFEVEDLNNGLRTGAGAGAGTQRQSKKKPVNDEWEM